MPYFQSTYHSKVYLDFREIDPSEYRRIIRFYEEREKKIKVLDFQEYFDLLVCYVNALFEIGDYEKHLIFVDKVIEASIDNNIQHYNNEDIYKKMLFKKAASLYNVEAFEKADYILRELLKMDPNDQDISLFLKKCLRKKNPTVPRNARAVAIFLFLMAALVLLIEVLIVQTFYVIHADLVATSRLSIFALGCIMLFAGEFYHRWIVEREVNNFISEAKLIKEAKSLSSHWEEQLN